MAHVTPAPKGCGSFSEDLSQGVQGRPPGNLPVPVIVLGEFERGT